MTEQWRKLKETIIEMRDNDGTGTQQEVCKFLVNLMDILEKQMSNQNKGDLISRKSLLNKINAYVVGSQDKEFICKLIKEMPSAENKGEWIEWKGRNGRYIGIPICSNCNTGFPVFAKDYKFCPACGAKMKGGE